MRPARRPDARGPDLVLAIGLVWGHLSARQFEQAFVLARGCLEVWPGQRDLLLMHAYAAAEMLEPVDFDALRGLGDPVAADWVRLVERRTVPQPEDPA